MDFTLSETAERYLTIVRSFMKEQVYPAEAVYHQQRLDLIDAGQPNTSPPVMEELKAEARRLGLWNLFMPSLSGMSNLDYAHLAEESGRSHILGPESMNCLSPDSGNMELLTMFGTDEQKREWLDPLLDGTIRSGFSMTEPGVASSDATNISTTITADGDDFIINGHKWWTTGGGDPRCKVLIVLGKSDPDAPKHRQHSMILVPRDAKGVEVLRTLPVYGYQEQQGHAEIRYNNVRVPKANIIGERGGGFAVAQGRLGPGRIHHCMRAIGMAERALELACQRVQSRTTFGSPLAEHGMIQAMVAESRIEIEQARLLVLKTAWLIDEVGVKNARTEISAIKVIAPRVACNVLDRAIQMHGAGGVSDDFPLAAAWSRARTLRIVDGPDEVHLRKVAQQEMRRYATR
jgi:acyl-CoA dehydrogenase